MAHLPIALEKLATLLARLPGIGERTATRLAFHMVAGDVTYPRELGRALLDVTERVRLCSECHMLAEGELCRICADPARDHATLCVVEGIPDLLAFERSGAYGGLYHVLHGVLSPLKGVGPDQLRLAGLAARVEANGATEVIVATNTDVEGEATALYLARHLAPTGARLTRIATGVPMGGELEYIDPGTLTRAIKGRTVLEA